MCITFEGSINNINERQLAFIKEVLEKRGHNDTKVRIDPVGAAGDNYMANVKRITVSDGNGVFKMVAKIAPENEIMRTKANTQMVFRNEHEIYTEIFPKFQELEAKAGVPDEDRFRFAACYGSLSEESNEIILLEDLQISGFIMVDRFKSLSKECVKSVLKNLASLHSLSFALKNIEPDTFETMKGNLFDMWSFFASHPQMLVEFSVLERQLEEMLDDEDQRGLVKGAITESFALAAKLTQTEFDSKYSVIQQGDSWVNNIMFNFDGDTLQQSVMIDYQLSKANSPSYDILLTIFNCTDHEARLEHFHDWIDYYHTELVKRLANYGLKADNVYPRGQLDVDMKKYARICLGTTLMSARVTTMQPEDAAVVMKVMESMTVSESHELLSLSNFDENGTMLCKKKVQGLIDSYLQFGLL